MRWLSRLLLVTALGAGGALAAVPAPAFAQGGERIYSYDVEMRMEPSGALVVTEIIGYDFGTAQKHGIIRVIPVRFRYDERRDRIYRTTVLSVEGTPGTPDEYKTERSGDELRVRIGDPDRTISGLRGYTIVYRVEGALNRFPDHDELYWNAVGTEWSVPINRVSARVVTSTAVSQVACYHGPRGSQLACSRQRALSFEETGLGPREGLTVVVAFPTGAFPPPQPILEERWSLARAFSVTPLTVGLSGTVLLLALLVVWLVLRSGRDRRPTGVLGLDGMSTAFAEYRPPDGLPPGLAALLLHEKVRPIDVTATIVDLADRGFLRIDPIGTGGSDWRLVRLRDPDNSMLRYERLLFDALFFSPMGVPRPSVVLSELKDHFTEQYKTVRKSLYEEAMGRGWFTTRPDHVRRVALVVGALVLVVGAALTAGVARFTRFGLVPIPIALAGLAVLIGAWWLPRRTATGHALFRRIASFRAYLRDIEFTASGLTTPDGSDPSHLLSRHLAYAMVFGLTAQWQNAVRLVQTAANPTHVRTYTPLWLTYHTDHFSQACGSMLTSTPASSGSSSSSGSGGFSGGGGGGGGGGSW